MSVFSFSAAADRAWFKSHPKANVHLRTPSHGEVEELGRRLHNNGGYEMALAGGMFPPPSPTVEWMVLVIKATPDTLLRMLTLRQIGAVVADPNEYAVFPVAIRDRVALDAIKG